MLHPEKIIEVQIEQSAIHIQQDGIYRVPIDCH